MLYGLSEADVRFLKELKREHATHRRRPDLLRPRQLSNPPAVIAKPVSASGIPALTAATTSAGAIPGTGDVDIYIRSTSTGQLSLYEEDVAGMNLCPWALSDDFYYQATKHEQSGKWLLEGSPDPGGSAASAMPAFAARNKANQSIGAYGSGVVALTTTIHRYPNDASVFSLSTGYVLTIKRTGLYTFKWTVPVNCTVTSAAWNLTLIEDTTGAYQIVPAMSIDPKVTGAPVGTYYSHLTVDHEVGTAPQTYQIGIANADGTGITIIGTTASGGHGPGARLDVRRVRDV